MNSFWIENDLKINKHNLNIVQKSTEKNSLICWLYMENQKYFITDLNRRLQANLSSRVRLKRNKPQNNRPQCLKISIKQYFYSSQLKFIFIYIDDLEIVGSELVDFIELKLIPSELMNEGSLSENKFGRTQITQINNATDPSSMPNTNKKSHPSDLSLLLREISPNDTYANFTIAEEHLKPVQSNQKAVVLNLNEAFVKNTQDTQDRSKKSQESNSQLIDESFDQNHTDNQQKISSQLNGYSLSFNAIANLSCIDESNASKATEEIKTSNIPSLTKSSIKITPLNVIHIVPPAVAISPVAKSDFAVPLAKSETSATYNNKITDDMSENLTNDEMNSSFSSSSSSPTDFANQISLNSPFSARKKKLMQKNNKACVQFTENQLTDDEEEVEFDKNSSRALSRRLMARTISTSSDSSSVRSLSNSSGNPSSKSSLFANKKRHMINERRLSASNEKKSSEVKTLFSPLSKQKNPNVRNLLNQLNHSLADEDRNNMSKQVNLAINKMQRRKRLYDPASQKVEEAFENNTNQMKSPEKRRLMSPIIRSTAQTPINAKDPCNNTKQDSALSVNSINDNSRRSIPAGQAHIINNTTCSESHRTSILFTDESLGKSVNRTQEALSKHQFKLNPDSLQQYLIGIRNSTL